MLNAVFIECMKVVKNGNCWVIFDGIVVAFNSTVPLTEKEVAMSW